MGILYLESNLYKWVCFNFILELKTVSKNSKLRFKLAGFKKEVALENSVTNYHYGSIVNCIYWSQK